MNVTTLFGSPRPGSNSTALAEYLLSSLERKGAHVRRYKLNKLNYRGCQGCFGCKTSSERCVLRDDLTDALDSLYEADVLLLASSVYYGDVTSQMKGFIDRIYSFYVPEFWAKEIKTRLPSGKKILFILTQGNGDESQYADIAPKYSALIGTHGFADSGTIRICGISPTDDILKMSVATAQADSLAENLLRTI